MRTHNKTQNSPSPTKLPRIIAWEITRRCPLACKHCRAGATDMPYQNELTTAECLRVLDSLALMDHPMIIWTGGEPMYRHDILELIKAATSRGLRSVMAPCGTLVTPQSLQALQEAGISACSFSVDGPNANKHDEFRGVQGAFMHVTRAMAIAAKIKMPFQINTTVSSLNQKDLPEIYNLALHSGAQILDLFFLVPVGRGKTLETLALTPRDTDEILRWAFEMDAHGPLHVRTTCAPQAVRIWNNLAHKGPQPSGCMGGRGFVFISHTGILQPCGFLDIPSGDLRAYQYNFRAAYENSTVFQDLRHPERYTGACGTCLFNATCGGCRARAYAETGNYMATEPLCPLNHKNQTANNTK